MVGVNDPYSTMPQLLPDDPINIGTCIFIYPLGNQFAIPFVPSS